VINVLRMPFSPTLSNSFDGAGEQFIAHGIDDLAVFGVIRDTWVSYEFG
jgi:hypothetical protein